MGIERLVLGREEGIAHPPGDGLIIVGATPWSTQFAQILKERGINVMIADRVWRNLKAARLANIPFYYGELTSSETDHNLEFSKYNTLLAATGNPAYNALVCSKYAHELGRERVFQISADDEDEHERKQISGTMRGRTLAYEELDYWGFTTLFQKGWRFRTTKVSEDFNMGDIKAQKLAGQAKLIGMIGDNKRLRFSQAEDPHSLKSGYTAILFAAEDEGEQAESKKRKKKNGAKKKENGDR